MRILHVIGYLGKGGDTSIVLSIMNSMDSSNYQFDFLTHIGANEKTIQLIRNKGSNVYVILGDVRALGPMNYYWEVRKAIKTSGIKYDAIHVHTSMQSGVALAAAKHEGIKKRICHSHTTYIQRKANILSRVISIPILRTLYMYYATDKIACSKVAGYFLFGHKNRFKVLYNAIDIYRSINVTDAEIASARISLGCGETDILIGHVASFTDMKNQKFIIKLATKIKKCEGIKFVLVGSGRNFEKNKNMALAQTDNVIFTGQRDDVHVLMKSFDCVLLPSLPGEGFPVTLIEAQSVGCKCLVSNYVTNEVDIGLNLLDIIDLNNVDMWIDKIKKVKRYKDINMRNLIAHETISKGYDIRDCVKQWTAIYDF